MNYIIFGLPAIVWVGGLTFIFLLIQITTGYYLTHGYPSIFKYHRINAMILALLGFSHAIFALSAYL